MIVISFPDHVKENNPLSRQKDGDLLTVRLPQPGLIEMNVILSSHW